MTSGHPPGPDGLPGLGNTHQFVRDPVGFYGICAEYGDLAHARIGRDDLYVVSHPDLVRQVLVDDAAAYDGPDPLHDRAEGLFDVGMTVVAGERWRHPRAAPVRLLDADRVPQYATATVRHAETMAALWDDGEVVAVDEAMRELTLDVLIDVLFGVNGDHHQHRPGRPSDGERRQADSERIREAIHAVDEAFDARPRASLVPGWVPTRANRRYRRALSTCESLVEDLVERRWAEGASGERDVLSSVLQDWRDRDTLDVEAVRDQLVAALAAGHETTAAALTFAAYGLASHPGVADRLRAEVDAVLGSASATPEDLPALGYTERVVKETLRRYPPQYATIRRPGRETELGGYDVSTGTTVVMPQYVVHNDPRWFTAPRTFRPERWATWDGPEFAYFPFEGGPRAAGWARFAMQELRLVVATLAQQVTFETTSDDPPELRFGTTLKPSEGLDLVVRERVETPRS